MGRCKYVECGLFHTENPTLEPGHLASALGQIGRESGQELPGEIRFLHPPAHGIGVLLVLTGRAQSALKVIVPPIFVTNF